MQEKYAVVMGNLHALEGRLQRRVLLDYVRMATGCEISAPYGCIASRNRDLRKFASFSQAGRRRQ